MKHAPNWMALAVALLAAGPAIAREGPPLSFSSGTDRVALIELYTSEGCSSCPPADRWLSRLKDSPQLWREFTPIAFHVDYWDYIGWSDPYASAAHSARQRRYASEGGARAVYTPGVFRDGLEWRDWRGGNEPIPADDRAGDLRIRVNDRQVDVEFLGTHSAADTLTVSIAVVGMGLTSRVTAGENEGRTLRHDFVALGLVSGRLARDEDRFKASLPLPAPRADADPVRGWFSERGQRRELSGSRGARASGVTSAATGPARCRSPSGWPDRPPTPAARPCRRRRR